MLAYPGMPQKKVPASKYTYPIVMGRQVPARYSPGGHTVQFQHCPSFDTPHGKARYLLSSHTTQSVQTMSVLPYIPRH